MIYQVSVNGWNGENFFIDLCNTEEQMNAITVRQLKKKICKHYNLKLIMDGLRLICAMNLLDDDKRTLVSYGVEHKSVIQTVIKVMGGGGPESPPVPCPAL
ncbi:unnamed protein product [Boreogadus saida]